MSFLHRKFLPKVAASNSGWIRKSEFLPKVAESNSGWIRKSEFLPKVAASNSGWIRKSEFLPNMYVAMSELLEKPDSKRFKARNAINRHFKTDLRTGASLCNNLDSDEYLAELVELAKELGFSFGAQITKKELFCLIAEYAKPIDVPMISELSDFKKEEILRNALYQSNLKNVKADGLYLQHILPEHQTTDICLAAIHNDGLALKYVHKQTPRICSEAVKENGHALQYVYEEYKTTEICLSALRDDSLTLKYISNKLMIIHTCV